MVTLGRDEPRVVAAVAAIHLGDLETLQRLLGEHPELATARVADPGAGGMSRTLLHVVTDWPGHLPNAAAAAATLIAAGAEVNARFTGPHGETPLHWAASSDDVAVLDALLDVGADIEAPGGVIGGGTPLDDVVAFAQWQAAQRLVDRGAQTRLWHEAPLGLMDRLEERFNGIAPTRDESSDAFWHACRRHREAAQYLLSQGAGPELDSELGAPDPARRRPPRGRRRGGDVAASPRRPVGHGARAAGGVKTTGSRARYDRAKANLTTEGWT